MTSRTLTDLISLDPAEARLLAMQLMERGEAARDMPPLPGPKPPPLPGKRRPSLGWRGPQVPVGAGAMRLTGPRVPPGAPPRKSRWPAALIVSLGLRRIDAQAGEVGVHRPRPPEVVTTSPGLLLVIARVVNG